MPIKLSSIKLLLGLMVYGLSQMASAKAPVVLMTDFGLKDGAVSAMKGVILTVDQALTISDLTHEIEPFNIKEAAYRLQQVMAYYPKGSVFVCVVDPGVGGKRRSIVAKLKNGYFFVGPDNGILTDVASIYGVAEVRTIDETINRLEHQYSAFQTFHGRDVFALTAAKLASETIAFEQVGKTQNEKELVKFASHGPKIDKGAIVGSVLVLDSVYGNVWTDIGVEMAKKMGFLVGNSVSLKLYHADKVIYASKLPFVETFGDVKTQAPLVYVNSLGNLAVALNQGNFAKKFNIKPGYTVRLSMA